MPVNKTQLAARFTEHKSPRWPCPTCREGYLRLDKESIRAKATAPSIAAQDHEAWDIDWLELRFVALAVCDNKDCLEVAAITGTGGAQYVGGGYDSEQYYSPLHFDPSPLLIQIPERCGNEVKSELRLAFAHAWGDAASSSAHIRTAVERLLDQLSILKTRIVKGKRKWLTLHERIEILSRSNSTAGELLLAVKWIGNAGVHSSALSQDEVVDALDILESALQSIFDSDGRRVRGLAKKINKRKRPR